MTAPGEDILAWLDASITRREEAAHAVGYARIEVGEYLWNTGYLILQDGPGGDSKVTTEVPSELAAHIALHDPASVLRRCAGDRKLLELHGDRCHSCPAKSGTGYLDEWTQFDYGDVCPVVTLLAEGYGWTKGEREHREQRRCGYTKRHLSHTFMRLEVLFQCPGAESDEETSLLSKQGQAPPSEEDQMT